MTFLNENWFWTGCFTLLAGLGGSVLKEWLGGKSQAKLERLRMHEGELLDAYKRLYRFITSGLDVFYPPEHMRESFIHLMGSQYAKEVKPDLLLFTPDIREVLREFEGQYEAVGDSDLIPRVPFEEFMENHAVGKLKKLREIVENRTDNILHKS